jgi:hypothetical protein
LGSEVLVHFTIAARQAATEAMRELAEDVGDDRVVGQLAGGEQPASSKATLSRSRSTSERCTSSIRRPGSRYAACEASRRAS